MKALFLLVLLVPLSLAAQVDSTFRLSPFADTLKPIGVREFPYTYSIKGSVHTVIQHIYSYDGIDIIDPRRTLIPTILAIDNPDANRELTRMQEVRTNRQTAVGVGLTLTIGGIVMMCVGGAQASAYQKELSTKRQQYYAVSPYSTVTTTKPVYVDCSIWTGITDPKSGITNYTCSTDSRITSTNPGLGSYPIPGTSVTSTSTVYTPRNNPPTSVDIPDGKGWLIAGLSSTLVGLVVSCLGNDGIDHFHRAVQFYNRSLSRRISWRLEPHSSFGQSGLTLRGRF